MLGLARRDVEILVHVSAPSRGPDDAKYRAMAQEYLNFGPARRQKMVTLLEEIVPDTLNDEVGSQLQTELQESTQETRESQASWQPDEERSADSRVSPSHGLVSQINLSQQMISPDLSFDSVADNVASPAFRRAATYEAIMRACQGPSQEQNSSYCWKPPPSSVEDSQPEPSRGPVVCSSPIGIFERYLPNNFKADTPSFESYGERVNETILNTSSEKKTSHSNTLPAQTLFSTLRSPGRRSERLLRGRKHDSSSGCQDACDSRVSCVDS